jgi:hypothetical protein
MNGSAPKEANVKRMLLSGKMISDRFKKTTITTMIQMKMRDDDTIDERC